jgi:UDP-N-acetylmuramyl-tripeptide synthetase
MAADAVKYCAMEVSSHSLDQDRVAGIDFKAAVFTNLTGEHLDYHKTLKDYLQAKIKLFSGLKRGSLAVLNRDDASFGKIAGKTAARVLTYGIRNKADITAEGIKFSLRGSEFLIRINRDKKGEIRINRDKKGEIRIKKERGQFKILSSLVGNYNVYNILAATAVALDEGIALEIIGKAVSEFQGAEGRLEAVPAGRDIRIFVDYAHTDNALENVLTALKPLARKRIITVFGCGGDRDRTKRPRMGEVASRLSDYVVITSDNPRSEEPSTIAREVEKGIEKNFKSYEIILDRFEAIKSAICNASSGDIILIAGKGHEKYQIIKDKTLPFSDKEAVLKILAGENP